MCGRRERARAIKSAWPRPRKPFELPGGVFNKGFVRAYSKYLGIDEEQAVADYMTAVGEAQAAARDSKKAEPPPPDFENRIALVEEPAGYPALPWGTLAVVAAVVAILAGGWFLYSRLKFDFTSLFRSAPQATSKAAVAPAPKSTASQPATPAPGAAVSSADQSVSSTSEPGVFVLHIRARQDAWVSVVADGQEVLSGILNASSEKDVRARQQVVLKTGNAGGVEVSLNGKPYASLGGLNEVRTLTFTADGIQQ